MALYTDGPIAQLADLKAYESSILDVASTEGVDVGAKLEISKRELSLELAAFLLRRGVALGRHRELTNVVATEPLLHVHALHTLGLIYRDAYNSQLNDRYLGKWKEYSQLAERALKQLLQVGVGICTSPVPQAHPPVLGTTPGGLLTATDYHVRVSWTNTSGFCGELSDAVAINADPETLLTVSGECPPAGAAGFHVYITDRDGKPRRQTAAPVPQDVHWVLPTAGPRSDLPAIPAQRPDLYVTERREWLRG